MLKLHVPTLRIKTIVSVKNRNSRLGNSLHLINLNILNLGIFNSMCIFSQNQTRSEKKNHWQTSLTLTRKMEKNIYIFFIVSLPEACTVFYSSFDQVYFELRKFNFFCIQTHIYHKKSKLMIYYYLSIERRN